MSKLQIELDDTTGDALTSLAVAQGTTPANLVGQIVSQYVQIHEPVRPDQHASQTVSDPDPLEAISAKYLGRHSVTGGGGAHSRRRDPLDAIVGSIDAEPVDDIDEVIYGRSGLSIRRIGSRFSFHVTHTFGKLWLFGSMIPAIS